MHKYYKVFLSLLFLFLFVAFWLSLKWSQVICGSPKRNKLEDANSMRIANRLSYLLRNRKQPTKNEVAEIATNEESISGMHSVTLYFNSDPYAFSYSHDPIIFAMLDKKLAPHDGMVVISHSGDIDLADVCDFSNWEKWYESNLHHENHKLKME